MATFYLVKHRKTVYLERNKKIYQGFGVNLSPLSVEGIKEIENTSKDRRLCKAGIILSSPIQELYKQLLYFQKNFK